MNEPIRVVCAVILRDGAVLVAQRPEGKAEALKWEFPGGKLEAGEPPQAALIRELQEELGVTVRVGDLFQTVLHDYGDRVVHLLAFLATLTHGEPRPLECKALRWVPYARLGDLDLCDADLPVRDRIVSQLV